MSFNWREYLNLAQELAGQTTTPAGQEAKQRAALSRAYYAAFCQARNHLRDKEGHSLPTGGRVHAYVRDQFKNSFDPTRNQKKRGCRTIFCQSSLCFTRVAEAI